MMLGLASEMARDDRDASLESLSIRGLEQVLDQLEDAPFCVKDRELRHVSANAAMAKLCGVSQGGELRGQRANVFLDELSSERWENLDRAVIGQSRPLRNVVEKVVSPTGQTSWFVVSRWPIFGVGNAVIGLATIARRLIPPRRKEHAYGRVAEAARFLEANVANRISIGDLAARLSVSVPQLERDFVSVFGVGPRRFLAKLRLDMAVDLLNGEASIAQVAHDCGYQDHSSFTRQFGAAFGISPTQFRRDRQNCRA